MLRQPLFLVPRRRGFTLVELLVVVLVLFLLFVVIVSATSDPMPEGKVVALMQMGSSVANGLLAADIEGLNDGRIYPESSPSNTFSSSTEYFRHVVDKGILPSVFSAFGGAGAREALTGASSNFNAKNNAWSVVVDVQTSDNDLTPLMFSRNLVLPGNRLPDGTIGKNGADLGSLLKETPDRLLLISTKWLVVITKSGSGCKVRSGDLGPGKAHLLNPTSLRLPVLRP